MRLRPSRLIPFVVACGLSACLGNGDESAEPPPGEGPPIDAPAPPPAPPPPGSSENAPPVAKAGPDRTTVEEQDVTIDGSGSSDPENDALRYAWQLSAAPQGSTLGIQADTPTLVFRPDLPGTYELRLTVTDGRSESTDTVRVRADPLLAVDNEVELKVEFRNGRRHGKKEDGRDQLELETSRHYNGQPVGFTAAADVSWLRVLNPNGTSAPPGEDTEVTVEVVDDEAEKLSGGEHEARVRITPAGGWEETVAVVTLKVERKGSNSLVPYVAYTGEASSVALYGDDLLAADGVPVFVDGQPVAHLKAVSNERGSIDLPALQAGEHEVRIGEGLGLSVETLRLVVRDPPVYRVAQLEVPGVARSLDYSAELDAFYAVFASEDGIRVAQRLQNVGTGVWMRETIPVAAPWALALTADGSRLLVSSEGCTVHHLDPRSLAVVESLAKSDCIPEAERFGVVAALADGRAVAVDDLGDSTSWTYPDLEPMPALSTPEDPPILNADRDRLVWSTSVLYAVGGVADARTFVPPAGNALFDFTRDAVSIRAPD